MNFKPLCAALLVAFFAAGASAKVTVYNSASFVPAGPGQVRLDGFGRTASTLAALSASPLDAAPLLVREPFFDTWNIDVSDIAAGEYSFAALTVNATGSLLFSSLTFNSYDANGVRNTVLFDIDSAGKQAVGSGTFTVLGSCPVASCVWIDVAGSQLAGGQAGYGGTGIAALVPEPASYALMALGLAAVGASRWRARQRAA